MASVTKIAVVQMKADINKVKNLKKIVNYVEQAAKRKSKLCAFPEFMMFYSSSHQSAIEVADLAEKTSGDFVTSICEAAKENSIQVVGTFYEKSQQNNRVYDTSFLVDKNGKLVSKYR